MQFVKAKAAFAAVCVLAAGSIVTACSTASSVHVQATDFQSAVDTANTAFDGVQGSSLETKRQAYFLASAAGRSAFDSKAKTDNPAETKNPVAAALLCNPIRTTVIEDAYQAAVASGSKGIVTITAASPTTDAGLIAALLAAEYKVPLGENGTDPVSTLGERALARCRDDVLKASDSTRDPYYAFLNFEPGPTDKSGREAGPLAILGALQALYEAVDPLIKAVLTEVDRQKRIAALKDFLDGPQPCLADADIDQAAANSASCTGAQNIVSAIKSLKRSVAARNDYDRRVAAIKYIEAFNKIQSAAAGDPLKTAQSAAVTAAGVYDTAFFTDTSGVYDAMAKAFGALKDAVENKDATTADIEAQINGFAESWASLNEIVKQADALKGKGDQGKKLQDAIDTLRKAMGGS